MGWLLTAVTSGALALFSTYWDDSLHTDAGRDSFWSAPHVLLYASILVTLAALARWCWSQVRREGLSGAAQDPLLRWAVAAGVAVAIAAPADAAWHTAFGRDAVLWSPPHLLAIVATFALTTALFRAITRTGDTGLPATAGGALVLAAALVPVMEYDSDVPQFSTVWYLPTVSVGVTLAIIVIRRFDQRQTAVIRASLLVTATRLLMLPVLAVLGHSTPIVPPVIGVAIVADLFHRHSNSSRWLPLIVPTAVHAIYPPLLPAIPHGTAVPAGQFVPSLLLGIAGSAVIVLVAEGGPRRHTVVHAAAIAASIVLALPLLTATRAVAHDPGQGASAGEAQWRASVQQHSVQVALTTTNSELRPEALVARRAGEEVTGRLVRDSEGTLHASVVLHASGRWFLYATFEDARDRAAETWLPIQQGRPRTVSESRPVYLPPPQTHGAGRTAATVVLYGLSAVIIAAVARSGRRNRAAEPRS